MSGIWKENKGNSEVGFEMSFLMIDFVMKVCFSFIDEILPS